MAVRNGEKCARVRNTRGKKCWYLVRNESRTRGSVYVMRNLNKFPEQNMNKSAPLRKGYIPGTPVSHCPQNKKCGTDHKSNIIETGIWSKSAPHNFTGAVLPTEAFK